jgi:Prealbumin-like fold domain
MSFVRPRRPLRALLLITAVLGLVLAYIVPASASHPEASLAGSNFEIDTNANLKVDDPAPSIDWASVTEARKNDLATGTNDDSYAGGVKEDDACPGTTTGSIPNNKSDLLTFGAYVEPEAGGPGFLNLFWTRVQEPSGTTLMDFELNQSSTLCANGVNPVRTTGDLLIEYRIEQGGAVATIKVREWTGSVWGPAQDLTAAAKAAGTINSTPIPVSESDGLSTTNPLSARTFGEAQLDLDFVLDQDKCESFGSAFLKSRASDSFTSQLKDFIKPVPVNITNCGKVVIHKVTDPASNPDTTRFGYTKAFGTDPASANTFTLGHGQSKTFTNVLFGSGYTVTEDVLPAGWDFQSLNCDASSGVTPTISAATVTFDIDSAADVLDCTYTNRARGTIIVEKITDDGAGSFDFTSATLTPSPFTLTTTAAGSGGKDSRTFGDLTPGTYDVAETVPAGWNLVSSSCDDGSNPASISLSGGETVTCTFHDARETGAVRITKTRKHAASGPGDHPHAGVDFKVTGGSLPAGGQAVTTDANGVACVDGLVLSSFSGVGDYTVTETVPAGYSASPTSDTVTVDNEATCGGNPYGGELVSFHNTPLTNLSVSVNSQVDGGTASTIECKEGTNTVASGSTGADGDGSASASDLKPGTYTCTVVIDP